MSKSFKNRGARFRSVGLALLAVAAASGSALAAASPSTATDHYYCGQSFIKGGQCGYGSTLSNDYRNRAYVPEGDGSHEACASRPASAGGGFRCALNNINNEYAAQSYYPYIKAPEGGTLQGLTSN